PPPPTPPRLFDPPEPFEISQPLLRLRALGYPKAHEKQQVNRTDHHHFDPNWLRKKDGYEVQQSRKRKIGCEERIGAAPVSPSVGHRHALPVACWLGLHFPVEHLQVAADSLDAGVQLENRFESGREEQQGQ